MDQDLVQEWKTHPVTKEIITRLKQKITSLNNPHIIFQSVDETALRNAHMIGILEGLSETFDIIAELEA